MAKRALLAAFFLLVVLAAAVALNTWRATSRQRPTAPLAPAAVDAEGAAQRLVGALRLRTVSSADEPALNADAFRALHEHLRRTFPEAHRVMRREVVGDLSLLYTWPGRDAGAAPILLLAHQDVAPIAPGTEKDWSVDPFAGAVRDGFVWGRGAMDDKGSLLGEMEAVERLAARGFEPRRTMLFAFGADEEVLGARGARRIAGVLRTRGVRPAFVLDEGMLIAHGIMPGLDAPLAVVGVAEKGIALLELRVEGTPGHAGISPGAGGSPIEIMAAALTRLAERPMPARMPEAVRDTLTAVAPEMSGVSRVALSNLWLFGPVVRAQLLGRPGTSAMLRTTMTFTRMHAGEAASVMPGSADAIVGCRLLPGDSLADVQAHVKAAIRDPRVEIRLSPRSREAPPVSRIDSPEYETLETTIREAFPGTVVAPGLMIAYTDSSHYADLSANVFRFSPLHATARDLQRFHGTDERLGVDHYADLIRFYERLLARAAGGEPSPATGPRPAP